MLTVRDWSLSVWSSFLQSCHQGRLVSVLVRGHEDPKTGPDWTFKHYLSPNLRQVENRSWSEVGVKIVLRSPICIQLSTNFSPNLISQLPMHPFREGGQCEF